ncbi:RraA family protein [Alteromonadaceae bacterium M269]|nr:RraA family protein [Alteromonadaceae bacterium M269]
MSDLEQFNSLSPADYANFLPVNQVLDFGIKELWPGILRIAGPAYTVQLSPGDHLMMHAAIYEAPEGSIIVVTGSGNEFAVAGGNVCAIAQKRGIQGFVIDGVIRDVAEIRESRFPVFARGVVPIPGMKKVVTPLNQSICCAGCTVNPNDIVIADEEGVVVLPQDQKQALFDKAKARADKEANMTLDEWQAQHQKKVYELLG